MTSLGNLSQYRHVRGSIRIDLPPSSPGINDPFDINTSSRVSRRILELRYRFMANSLSITFFRKLFALLCITLNRFTRLITRDGIIVRYGTKFDVFERGTHISVFFFLFFRQARTSSAGMMRITVKRIKTLLRSGADRKRFAAYTCTLQRHAA